AAARLGRLAKVQVFLAVGREAGVEVEPALGEPPLLGAIRLHQVELVAPAVGRVAIGARDEPLAVGRPVLDRVGVGDGQLDGVAAVGVDPPGLILPRRRGPGLVGVLFEQFLLGRDQVLAVGGPDRAATLVGDLARVVAASGIAVPDAVVVAAEDHGLAVGGDADVMPVVGDLLP